MSLSLKELQKHAEDILPHRHGKKSSSKDTMIAGTGGKTNYRILPNLRFAHAMPIALLVAGVGVYSVFFSQAATPTTKPPFALGCEAGATNVTTAAALRTAVSNGQNSCVTSAVGDVNLSSIQRASPVYVGTNGGSIGSVDIVGSKNIVIRQARLKSVDIRDSNFITIEKSTLGGTSSSRVLNNLITSLGYSPGIDTSNDVTVQDNDIGWTTADTSGNTGYGIRVYGGDRFKVLRNYIHHIGADGIQMGSDGVDNIIDRNEIAYVAPPSTSDEHSDDIQITGHGPNLKITNNYLHHNGWLDAGGQKSGGSGPYIHGGSGTNSLLFENNLVRDEQNFMQVADLGTGGTAISNLTFRRNTFYNNGTMWPDGTDLSWQIASGSNNLFERNVINDNFGNKYGFGNHTSSSNNLIGSQNNLDVNNECTVAACNPPSQEAIGYRCPTGVWWCDSSTTTPPPPPPTSTLKGDLNNDNSVNTTDLIILLSKFGTADPNANLNSQGNVDTTDLIILLSLFGTTGGGTTPPPTTTLPINKTLGFNTLDTTVSDEFNGASGTKPDSTRWGSKNFTASNGSVVYWNGFNNVQHDGSGNLDIFAEKTASGWNSSWLSGNKSYTGIRYMEARAKVPGGLGPWSAPIWEWDSPYGSLALENDVIEQLGFEPQSYHTTLHANTTVQAGKSNVTSQTLAGGYHTYGAAVYADRVDYYFDGTKIQTISKAELGNNWGFDTKAMVLNISQDMGGWGGQVTVASPVHLLVDYIRVYTP